MKLSGHAVIAGLLVSMMAAELSPGAASAGMQGKSTRHVTFVYGHPTRLTVLVQEWSRTTKPNGYVLLGKGTTKDRAMIANVANVLNQVDVPNRQHTCPLMPSGRNILQFGYANGDVWTVYEGGCWNFSAHGIFGTGVGDPPEYALLPVLLSKLTGVQEGT